MRAEGKVVIITGSTKGIGRIAAGLFAREGAKVVVSGRSTSDGEQVVAEIRAAGGEATFVPADVSREEDCAALVQAAVREFGRLDILINNAAPVEFMGSGGDNSVTELSADNLNFVLGVTVLGTVMCCKYAIPHIQHSGGGSIIMVSSVASLQGLPRTPAYSASKGAINALVRQIAVEYGRVGIRCNGIALGFIPVGVLGSTFAEIPALGQAFDDAVLTRRGRGEDAANAMLYLATDESGYVNGSLLVVDGGITARSVLPDMSDSMEALLAK